MRSILLTVTIAILSFSSRAQELEMILEAHYAAAAQEKMEKINTIITTGKNIYSMAGFESSFVMYQERPNKIRIQGDIQGSRVIQTFNGTTGWMYAPAMGIPEPKEMKGQELETILNQTEFENPLWKFEEKGNQLELIGKTGDGTGDQLKLTTRDGDVLTLTISRESHLITSIMSKQVMGGAETTIEVLLSDYKNIRGIPVAHQVTTKMNGEVVTTIQIGKVEYNKPIDPALFEKPVAE